MKKITYFSALDLYVPLEENEYFFDDGVKEDLDFYVKEICKRYKIKVNHANPQAVGICLPIIKYKIQLFPFIKIQKEKYVHIAYKENRIDFRAHEEAHALRYLGKLKYLFAEIGRKFGKGEMIKTMLRYLVERIMNLGKSFQYDGYIGTTYALCKHNMIKSTVKTPSFNEALTIMEMFMKENFH